jgi:hypothetical protein
MTRRTFNTGTFDTAQDEPINDEPLMTFTLIDGDGGDELDLESEVLAAFGAARTHTPSSGVFVKDEGSTLRRILGTNRAGTDPAFTAIATPSIFDLEADQQCDAVGAEESGSLLRPHPAVDRLESGFTVVPPNRSAHHPASRQFLRRLR